MLSSSLGTLRRSRAGRAAVGIAFALVVTACSSNNPNADIPRSSSTSASSTTTSTTTTTTTVPGPPPVTAPPPRALGPVKAGALCTQLGEVGLTIAGVPMTCLDHSVTGRKPYANGRFRWTG